MFNGYVKLPEGIMDYPLRGQAWKSGDSHVSGSWQPVTLWCLPSDPEVLWVLQVAPANHPKCSTGLQNPVDTYRCIYMYVQRYKDSARDYPQSILPEMSSQLCGASHELPHKQCFELREPTEMGSARWQFGAFPCCYPVDMQVWEGNQPPMRAFQTFQDVDGHGTSPRYAPRRHQQKNGRF
jgi:hypothetical protein